MSWFFPKTMVERNEEQFNTKRMENREVYHELNIRGGDPELLRTQVLELVEDMGYDIIINKFSKFESSEFENIFQAGRLKPLRAVMNAEKRVETGTMFPWMWKLVAFLGLFSLLVYLVPQSVFDDLGFTLSKNYFIIAGVVLLFSSAILWFARRIDTMTIWFKASGIYNVEDENTDFKVILSGATTSEDKVLRRKLDDEITEIFRIISKKYVKEKEGKKKAILELPKSSKDFDVTVIKSINSVEDDLRGLDSRLANGEINEATYNEVKENLEERKRKLETILDLINV
ncbi:MAG: hypothetical protein JW791_05490 [Nanoarchaeota archaeon]|nr:hypothetical protein [Nanoarchaeota archaeon]